MTHKRKCKLIYVCAILMVLCGIPALSQESLSFRSFENIFKEGISFTENDIVSINGYSFVSIKNVNEFVFYIPVFLDGNLKGKGFGGYSSGGYVLLQDTKKNCYFEIRIDHKGIHLEKKESGLYETGATLFYEFKKGYSIGIAITLITDKYKKYRFNISEHKNQIVINSKCTTTEYCKVLTIDTNLDNLDLQLLIKELYNLNFETLYAHNESFYFRDR